MPPVGCWFCITPLPYHDSLSLSIDNRHLFLCRKVPSLHLEDIPGIGYPFLMCHEPTALTVSNINAEDIYYLSAILRIYPQKCRRIIFNPRSQADSHIGETPKRCSIRALRYIAHIGETLDYMKVRHLRYIRRNSCLDMVGGIEQTYQSTAFAYNRERANISLTPIQSANGSRRNAETRVRIGLEIYCVFCEDGIDIGR